MELGAWGRSGQAEAFSVEVAMTLRLLAGISSVTLTLTQTPVPPATSAREIYLAPFTEGPPKNTRIGFLTIQRSGVKVGKPVNITNHPGDDTQPCFLPDSSGLWFTSARDGEPAVYRYDLAAKTTNRAPELSPQVCAPATTAEGRRLIPRPKLGTQTFVDARVDGIAMIREIMPDTSRTRTLATALEGSDDLTWTPGGLAIMARRSSICLLEMEDDRWYEFADLKKDGLRAITRVAISPDSNWIAIVSDPAVK